MTYDELLKELDRIKQQEKADRDAEKQRLRDEEARLEAEAAAAQQAREETAQKDQEKISAKAEAARMKEERRLKNQLQLDLTTKRKSLAAKDCKLHTPKIFIQDQANQAIKDEWRTLGVAEKKLLAKGKGFSHFLLKFGDKRFSIIALLLTQAIGLYWVWAELGLDAAGSTWLTVLLAVMVLMAIDVIGYFAVAGSLASLENFMAGKRYHRMLEAVFAGGFGIGLLCFLGNAIFRVMEAAI